MQLKYGIQLTIVLISFQGYILSTAASGSTGKSKHYGSLKRGRLRRSQEKHYIGKVGHKEAQDISSVSQRSPFRTEGKVQRRYFNVSTGENGHEVNDKRYGETNHKSSSRRNLDPFHKALLQGQQTFENSVMLENWKENNQYSITRNLKRARKVYGSRPNIRSVKIFHPGSFSSGVRVHNKRRKSDIAKEVRVHGHSGSLEVHTATGETRLESKSGDLDLFIKNSDRAEPELITHGGERDKVPLVGTEAESETHPQDLSQVLSRKYYSKNYVKNPDFVPDSRPRRKLHRNREARKVKNFEDHECLVPPCTL